MSSSSKFKVFLLVVLIFLPLIAFDFNFSGKSKNLYDFSESVNQNYFLLSRLFPKDFYVMEVVITGYSSVPWETDEDPFVTASGKPPRVGTVAANFLPFGTKIRIPEIFGDQVFVVEDRMHPRYQDRIDIWFPNSWQAKQFGIRKAKVYIF